MLKNLKMVTILAIVTIVFSFIGCKQNVYIPVPMGGGEVNLSPMTVRLTKTPELSNTTKTISVIVETVSEIEKVVWDLYRSSNPQELLNNSSATSLPLNGTKNYEFDVTENGTYYVAVKDKLGRQEMATIYVNEFDRTPPNNITNFKDSSDSSQINFSWVNPTSTGTNDSPLTRVNVYSKTDLQNEYLLVKTYNDFSLSGSDYSSANVDPVAIYYDLKIELIDELGNVNCNKARAYIDKSKQYSLGDVILKNGDVLQYSSTSDTEYTNNRNDAVAVIYAVVNNIPYGVGVKQSNSSFSWATYDSTRFNTDFEGIKCSYTNNYSGGVYTQIFTGDTDGSDNWEYICSIDPSAVTNTSEYPAFNFAINYATTAGLIGTSYESGWYVPSIAELYDVYTNKDAVNVSLEKLSVSTIGSSSSYYWSSSQSPYYYSFALKLDFSNGYADYDYKSNNNCVLVVRAF